MCDIYFCEETSISKHQHHDHNQCKLLLLVHTDWIQNLQQNIISV